ncbi:MAG: hypothetical protein ACJAYJ_002454 [Saprospiraceae bacterium]|jgi:hypothetical protein
MKNTTIIFMLLSMMTSFACGETASEKSTATSIIEPVSVTDRSAESSKALDREDIASAQVSTDVKEKTAIIERPLTKESLETEKIVVAEKKVDNSKKQPTTANNTASVKERAKVKTRVKPTEKTTKVTPPVEKPTKDSKVDAPKNIVPNHSAWNDLLEKNVSAAGKVNYKGFKAQKTVLQNYLDELAANPPTNSWGRKEAMSYWINAYNAFTVKLIVDNYPLKSITDLEGGKPWDKKWIKLGGKTYSLNNIENDILRPKYKDARIHFAVNCAAISCPPILNKAWTASNLNANFNRQAKAFINNPKFNKTSADAVEISKIFDWYAADFDDIITYLNKYSTTKINAGAKVSYMEYDWALNE